jgi:hypothetical protein
MGLCSYIITLPVKAATYGSKNTAVRARALSPILIQIQSSIRPNSAKHLLCATCCAKRWAYKDEYGIRRELSSLDQTDIYQGSKNLYRALGSIGEGSSRRTPRRLLKKRTSSLSDPSIRSWREKQAHKHTWDNWTNLSIAYISDSIIAWY